jgi:FkbM family methyltransferase
LWLLRAVSTSRADPADVYYCYRLLLDRAPEPAGWRDQLKFLELGHSRRALVDSFLSSSEYRALRERSTFTPVETERFTMWVDVDDQLVAPGIVAEKAYEPHVTAVLEREIKPGSTFVDIGANMGWFTLLAAGVAGQVIAIEPNPTNVQLIYRSLLANQYENVRVVECAVTDRPNLLRLNFLRSNGSVAAIDNASDAAFTIVQGQPLDALLRDVERVDVIKMDIEGHEPVALRGMMQTLKQFQPVLVFEMHPLAIRVNAGSEPADLLDGLAALGYRLAVIRPDGTETPPLDTAAILEEWQAANRARKLDGSMHLDLIGRPQ